MTPQRAAMNAVAVFVLTVCQATGQAPGQVSRTLAGEHWVASWSTASVVRPQPGVQGGQEQRQAPPQAPQAPAPPPITISNQTVREIVHLSIGGTHARLVLANTFGTAPLTVGAAEVALHDKDARIIAGSEHKLTFAGRRSVVIPAGAVMVSDAVSIAVPSFGDLVVDLFLPDDLTKTGSPSTIHPGANQTNYISAPGNFAGSINLPVSAKLPSWLFLADVEVEAPPKVSAAVAFGDSITDGTRSTADKNARWPDELAKRLAAKNGSVRAVLNSGIAANRVLGEINSSTFPFGFNAGVNALARFDRDVLAQTGITHVIVLEGINDIGLAGHDASPSADDLIAAHQQMIERAHAHGLTAFGATLLPFKGAVYWSEEGEAKREAFNKWLRTSNGYDGVIDFDLAVRDPANPNRILAQYDSGDHLHPNDAGYKAMGDAIDLKLFEPAQKRGNKNK